MIDERTANVFAELARHSWDRWREAYRNQHIDDVLVGSVVASMVRSGNSLIGINSDGVNHHLRFENLGERTRLVFRLSHLSEDLATAKVNGHLASVVVGYGERVPNIHAVWGRFEAEARDLFAEAPEPGIISFDADLSNGFIYAQVSLLLDLDRYIEGDFTVRLDHFQDHVDSVVRTLAAYLRGRLGTVSAAASDRQSRAHLRELKQSQTEILVGEIVALMAEGGYSVIGMESDGARQRIRFHPPGDVGLSSVSMEVDRLQRAAMASLTLHLESKRYVADPRELLALHAAGGSSTSADGIAVRRRLHTTVASTSTTVPVQGQLDEAGRATFQRMLGETIQRLQQALEGELLTTGLARELSLT